MSLNKVMLIGNVGKDPEVRHLENNLVFVSFTIATTERYKDKSGEFKEQTEWHTVVCWRSLAEMVEKYVKKGSQIFVEGKIKTRSWDDQSGQKKYTTEILAENIRLLGRKSDSNTPYAVSRESVSTNSSANQKQNSEGQAFANEDFSVESDDLPF